MATQPRSASEHYQAAERLCDLTERLLVAADESTDVADDAASPFALLAIVHALLAQAPRRARRSERQARHGSLPRNLDWGDERK